jgi:hypothetical protein
MEGSGVMELEWDRSFSLRPELFSGRRFDREAFLAALLVALRITFAVGIGCLIIRQVDIVSVTSSLGWILLFFSALFASQPVFGALNVMLPAIAIQIALVYVCSAITLAYPGTGLWAVLSGGLCFLSVFVLSWGAFPTLALTTLFLGPFCFVFYSYAGGSAAIPSMVTFYGNAMAIILTLSLALGYMALCVVPITACWLVKRKFQKASELLSRSMELLADPMYSRFLTSSLLVEARKELVASKKLLPLAQVELFLASIDGYKTRLQLLTQLHLVISHLRTYPSIEPELRSKLQSHAVLLRDIFKPHPEGAPFQDAPVAEDANHQRACIDCIQQLLGGFKAGPYSSWSKDFLKGRMQHVLTGFLSGQDDLKPAFSDYVRSIHFRQRLLNLLMGAVAITFASLFALIPAWRNSFYDGVWPIITAATLWSSSAVPSVQTSKDKLLGVVVGGFLYYGIVALSGVDITNVSQLQGILVSLVFLFSLLFHSRPGLRNACLLVMIVSQYEVPLFGGGGSEDVADWLFSRLMLTFLGALIVIVCQSVLWMCYPPLWLYFHSLDAILSSAEQAFETNDGNFGSFVQTERIHSPRMDKALDNALQLPTLFLVSLPANEFRQIGVSVNRLVDAINLSKLLKLPLLNGRNRAFCAALISACRALSNPFIQVFRDIDIPEKSRDDDFIQAACLHLYLAVISAASAYDTSGRAQKLISGKSAQLLETVHRQNYFSDV